MKFFWSCGRLKLSVFNNGDGRRSVLFGIILKSGTSLLPYLLFFTTFFISNNAYSASISSRINGNWSQASTWTGGKLPAIGDDVVINHVVTVETAYMAEVRNVTINNSGKLVVNGTLVVNGNFIMNFSGNDASEFVLNSGSIVIVKGNVYLTNKISLNLSSYFIVRGNLLKDGSTSQGDIIINNASIYVIGTIDTNTGLTGCSNYDGLTETIQADCDVGNGTAFENNANSGTIPPGIAELVDRENCCATSAYISRNAYTGDWKDVNSWATPNESWRPLPPPNNPTISQALCINGYITLHDNLSIQNTDVKICDTLVVTGNLFMTSNSLTVGPNGVLIVLGNFTSGSGSLVNNEGGRIIFAGDFQQNQSYSFTDYGDIYIFSEPATTYGFVPKGLTEFELNEKDSPLFDFYCSLIDGGCQPEADVTPPSIACPANASYGCVKDLPQGAVPKNVSYSEFVGWGGSASDNQTLSDALTITYEDVADPGINCKVIRTYTVTDAASNSATCQQVFTITDTEKPTITCDYLENFSPNNDDCTAALTIDEPIVTDGCRYGDEHAHFSYRLANQGDEVRGEGSITATFPLGTTTITWTYADECGNSASCEQNIVVVFPLTPIFYDDNKTQADNGPGMNPMLTSTHSYFVDNKTPQAGYSYDWKLYENVGGNPGVVVSSGYTVTTPDIDNPSFVSITFLDGLATGNYLLSLTKTKNTTCEKQELLPLTIQANTFDAQLQAGNECQAGETDVPTMVSWGISFPGSGIEPYQFDFNIILTNQNGNSFPVCQGTVGGITSDAVTSDLSISSSCGDMGSLPYLEVIKSSGNYQVSISYTVSSITASDFDVDISIDASDQFSVSEIHSDNNSKTIKLWGIPDTSDIETD